MKKQFKRMMILSVVAALLVPTMVGATTKAPTVTVKVNGAEVQFPDAKPYVESNRVLIPMRFVSEALGGQVAFKKPTVIVEQADKSISLTIDSKLVTVNDKKVTLDVPARIKQNRTYVPIRFVSEALGATVSYANHTVTITTQSGGSDPVSEPKDGFQVDPKYNALAPLVFKNNVRVEGDELVFTVPKLNDRTMASYEAWGEFGVELEVGKEYRYKLGANAYVSIAYAHADEQIEGYMLFLDPKYKALDGKFDSVTGDVIVSSMNTSIPISDAPLSEVLAKYK